VRATTSPGGAALGLVPHTGWAWLVRVAGSGGQPRIELRARVTACDVVAGELYHLAANERGDRERFVATRRAAAVEQARRALAPHVGGARAAVIVGPRRVLPSLERIVAAHPLTHAAEGELWRAVFAEACAAAGLTATRAEVGEVRRVLRQHGSSAVGAFLTEGKRTVGSPWSREPQEAALAAWSALP
jgi:hypothetical protein